MSIQFRLYFCVSAFCILHSTFLSAQGPAWWYSRGLIDTNCVPNDYAPLEQGQLKWMAQCACVEMESLMGAGASVVAMVNAFSTTNGYRLANIGQLKYVGSRFYDRLYELNLTNTFPANMPGYYPWGNSSTTNDYAVANIGQAKYVFSFDSSADSDGDGISDWQEVVYGTNPYNPDTDSDNYNDDIELQWGTDPTSASSFPHAGISGLLTYTGQQTGTVYVVLATNGVGNGIIEYRSFSQPGAFAFTNVPALRTYWLSGWRDSDGDGSNDFWEAQGNSTANPVYLTGNVTNANIVLSDPDSDSDGLLDWWEVTHGLNPYENDAALDADGDGLTNLQEYQYVTNPNNPDTDGDGMPDGWEVAHGLNPLVNDAALDPDNDGLTNLQEYQNGTDPHNPDTDGDNYNDAIELQWGTDPTSASSFPHAGISGLLTYTGQQTGTVYVVLATNGVGNGIIEYQSFSQPDAFAFTNIPALRTYWLSGWRDSDGNSSNDFWEAQGNSTANPVYLSANVTNANIVLSDPDSDGDGLPDWDEIAHGTDTYDQDTDGDGLSDGWEVAHNTDPLDANDYDQAARTSEAEEARQRIIQHWLLFYGNAPAFTNTPGSQADLIDLNNALNALSEKFYNEE